MQNIYIFVYSFYTSFFYGILNLFELIESYFYEFDM
jgi:hypothetical protein